MARHPRTDERKYSGTLLRVLIAVFAASVSVAAQTPLELRWEESKLGRIDGVLRMSWRKKSFRFASECKRRSSPKAIEAAAERARQQAESAKLLPLVVVPIVVLVPGVVSAVD